MKYLILGIGGVVTAIVAIVVINSNSDDSEDSGFEIEDALPDFAEAAVSESDEPSLNFVPTTDITLENTKSGNSYLDRPELLLPVYNYSRQNGVDPRVCLGLCHKESANGNPKYFVGDTTSKVGPSIGPMQVSLALAIEMGMWIPESGMTDEQRRAAYQSRSTDIDFCVSLGCAAFARKLNDASGDYVDAIRRYNGSGPKARAYRDDVVQWLNSTFGE